VIQEHVFLLWELDVGEWSASRFGLLSPGETDINRKLGGPQSQSRRSGVRTRFVGRDVNTKCDVRRQMRVAMFCRNVSTSYSSAKVYFLARYGRVCTSGTF
jgi:hypothetical protein